MSRPTQQEKKPSLVVRLVLCLLILVMGVGGFIMLKKMKKSPPQRPVTQPAIPVEVMITQPRDFPVTIYGYGDVKARTRVTLSAEVSGRVLRKGEHLLAGAVVNKGDVLFAFFRSLLTMTWLSMPLKKGLSVPGFCGKTGGFRKRSPLLRRVTALWANHQRL